MTTKNKGIWLAAFFLFIGSFIVIQRITYNLEEDKLIDYHQVTLGFITDFGVSSRISHPPEYTYNVGGEYFVDVFKRSLFCPSLSAKDKLVLQKVAFPVVYDPNKPEVSRMVFTKLDYATFKINYPDSLHQLLARYFECD